MNVDNVQQFHRLNEAIQQKRPNRRYSVILKHDNMPKAAIQLRNLEILPRPPYSPDLAPSDFHLF